MEFKHINRPEFGRERDGAVQKIMRDPQRHDWSIACVACEAYNEGYKQALRDWSSEHPDGKRRIAYEPIEDIIEEVDQIDRDGKSTEPYSVSDS